MSEQSPKPTTDTESDFSLGQPSSTDDLPAAQSPPDPSGGRGDDGAIIDLTEYKTDELRQRFQQLFGVVHLLPWAGAGLGGTVIVFLSTWAVLFSTRAAFVVAALTLVYMGLQGFFLGILAAALLVVTRILQQLTAIVDITLQTIREAFRDIQKIGDPQARSELTGALVHGAILPTIQSVITVKMGLLRVPLSFVVNRVLKKTATKLTEGIEQKGLSQDIDEQNRSSTSTETEEVNVGESESDSADSHLDKMRQRIDVIAHRTRRATLIPALIFFVVAACVSSIPWLIALLILV